MSEEKQGQHIVEAASKAGVKCFLWSTLPSSREISGGKFMTRLYEGIKALNPICAIHTDMQNIGKQSVDAVIRSAGLKGCFIRTGNFYENMILRKYAAYDKESDTITMTRPIIGPDAERLWNSTPFRLENLRCQRDNSDHTLCRERSISGLQSHI
jgi:hypothetical protein